MAMSTFVVGGTMSFFVALLIYQSLLFLFQPPNIQIQGPVENFEILDSKNSNFFHFIQCSDIHLSWKYNYRRKNFDLFLKELKETFKPEFVLSTGDVADSYWQGFWVHQNEVEFKEYQETLKKYSETFNKTNWFDLRGNHDNYNAGSIKNAGNYFNKYSFYGKDLAENHSMIYVHETKYGKYKFIGIEGTPESTPLMPHNFMGRVDQVMSDSIEEKLKRDHDKMNHTIVFGHYPLSVLHTNARKSLFQLFKENQATAYLSGHLHTIIGFFPYLKAKIPHGHLELELADFKATKKLRLLSFDHDIFSFTDFYFDQWPVIHITNPKEAKYLSENEPLYKLQNSTHIRMLLFSRGIIQKIRIFIDGKLLNEESTLVGNNMFVTKWNSKDYSSGLHSIRVEAEDSLRNRNVVEYIFSLDGTVPILSMREISAHLVLRMDWTLVFRILYYFLFGGMSIVLLFCKLFELYHVQYRGIPIHEFTASRENFFISWVNRFLLLANSNILFFYIWVYGIIISLNQHNMFIFGVMLILETYYPFIFYFALSCDPKFSIQSMFLIHVSMLIFCVVRLVDCLWHVSKYLHAFPFGLWPLSTFEFFLINALIIAVKIMISFYKNRSNVFCKFNCCRAIKIEIPEENNIN
jgi:hypothetical protein